MKKDTGQINGVATAEITGSDISEIVAECMPFVRQKSKAFYEKDIAEELQKKGETIIDRHAGSGTFYTVKLLDNS